MEQWEDYFNILQVHYMAEPEVIESAYKRLAKKYHPDVNQAGDASEMMSRINRAYQVLSDAVSRKQYFIRWMQKYSGFDPIQKQDHKTRSLGVSFQPIQRVLDEYFDCIAQRNYALAYALLSEHDAKNISKREFIKWQNVVAQTFQIRKHECMIENIYSELQIDQCLFEWVVIFRVKVVEMNQVMDRVEEDEFLKSIVLENKTWRVFLGYKDLGAIINKFHQLARLKKQREANQKALFKQTRIDDISGLPNSKVFLEKADQEQARHERYGNAYSVIVCAFDSCPRWRDIRLAAVRCAGRVLASSLRKLDLACRWKGKTFILLLPETDAVSALKVAQKLDKKMLECLNDQGFLEATLSFVILGQGYPSLRQLIEKAAADLKKTQKDKRHFIQIG